MAIIDIIQAHSGRLDQATLAVWAPLLDEAGRLWLVRNRALDKSLVLALAKDPSARVRAALIGHQNPPTRVVQAMVDESNDAVILAAAAEFADLTAAQVTRLAQDPRPSVRAAVLAGASTHLNSDPQLLVDLLTWAKTAQLNTEASWGVEQLLSHLTPGERALIGVEGVMAFADNVSLSTLGARYLDWPELWDAIIEALPENYEVLYAASAVLSEGGQISKQGLATLLTWEHAENFDFYPPQEEIEAKPQSVDEILEALPTMEYSDATDAMNGLGLDTTLPIELLTGRLLDQVLASEDPDMGLGEWLEAVEPWYARMGAGEFTELLIATFRERGLMDDGDTLGWLTKSVSECAGSNGTACTLVAELLVEAGTPEWPAKQLARTQWATEQSQDLPLPIVRVAGGWNHPAWAWLLEASAIDGVDAGLCLGIEQWMTTFTGTARQLAVTIRETGLAGPTRTVNAPTRKVPRPRGR